MMGEQNKKAEATGSFALFSGGHDSLCATHYAIGHGIASEVVHVNTGIGIEQTREFVRDTCREQGWTLNEVHPPFAYEDIVVAEGFPGPAAHRFMYIRLKERALAAFARERKTYRGQPLTFVTGVRRDESVRRTGHVSEYQPAPKLGWTWRAPIWDWSKSDCNAYMAEHGLPRNEVVDILHMSGECLCGSYARPGERNELKLWFPTEYARIQAIEQRVRESGHPACVWGQRPPNVARGQMQIDVGPLCSACEEAA